MRSFLLLPTQHSGFTVCEFLIGILRIYPYWYRHKPRKPGNGAVGNSSGSAGGSEAMRSSIERGLCFSQCDAKMYHMRKASIRDLRYRFSVVENLLREGEEIQITKRKRVIARLLPPEPPATAPMPDFLARQKKVFGKKRLKVSGAELLAQERERF